jgi:putative ABC transport system substrate-binding protein
MLRRSFLARTLAAAGGAWEGASLAAAPAVPAGTRRLSVLLQDRPEIWAFFQTEVREELAALGWVEGTNLVMQWRYAHGEPERLRALAAELVGTQPDAILTRGTPATQALQRATTSIPILTGVGDPIGAGFARSFAAPGGNITGLSWATTEMIGKQLEVLRELLPQLTMLRLVRPDDSGPYGAALSEPVDAAARKAGLATAVMRVSSRAELGPALRAGSAGGRVAAYVFGIPSIEPKAIAEAALAGRMPTMSGERAFVEAGGLASYKLNWDNQTRRAAAQIDKVFRGEKPGRIPFELPTRAELAFNRSTARALGVGIPQLLLLQADFLVD